MASRYAVETVFKLIDNCTPQLDKIGVKGKTVGNQLKKDFLKAQDQLAGVGNRLKTMAKYAVAAGAALVGMGMVVATKAFIEFDQAATNATAKFKDLDVTSASYAQSLEQIKKAARDVAAVTEYSAVETAGALEKMAMAGLTSEQSMAMLMGTTNLATAAGLDLISAVDIATDTMGAFRLMTDEAGNALDAAGIADNMDRVSDVFAKTTNMFNTDMNMMFEAIKKGGPQFADAGQSIETFSSLVGVMANSGIKGSEAGTALRNIMLRLAAPTGEAAKLMKDLGIQTQDADGNYLDIIDVIGQFEDATKSLGSAERAAAMSTIFGSRSVSAMNILMAEGAEGLRVYRDELNNCGGAAADIAEAMRGSIGNRIAVLKSTLMELGFKFVEAFQEKGMGALESLTNTIREFDPAPIINGVMAAVNVIGKLLKIVWDLRAPIIAVTAAVMAYKGIMLAAAFATKAYMVVIRIIKGVKIAWTAVQWALNAAMTANPIGIIIMAVAALIACIIALVMNFDKVKEGLKKLGAFFKEIFGKIGNFFKNIWGGIKDAAGKAWDGIKGAASKAWDGIKGTANKAWEGIKGAAGKAGGWLKNNWKSVAIGMVSPVSGGLKYLYDNNEKFRNVVDKSFEKMKELGGKIWDLMPEGLQNVLLKVKDLFLSAIDKIKDLWNGIKDFFIGLWDAIKQGPSAVIEYIKDAFFGLFENIKEKFFGFIDVIKEGWEKVKGFFGGVAEGAKNIVGKVGDFFTGGNRATAAVPTSPVPAMSAIPSSTMAATVQPTTPMTPAQQQAIYSRSESTENVNINVRAAQGTQAQINRQPAPASRVQFAYSGAM